MTIKEYVQQELSKSSPSLKAIYEEMLRLGHLGYEIYSTINTVILENIDKTVKDYLRNKENK